MVTQNAANNKTGALGTVLQGQGVGTASDFSTATYPSTTTINQVLYSSATNVISEIATANNGVMIASNTGVPSMLAAGTINQVLTANTSAPPSWKASNGYVVQICTVSLNAPANSTTYYLANGLGNITATGFSSGKNFIPNAGTIKKVYGTTTVTGTLGSGESITYKIRLNGTTNTDITTTAVASSAANAFSNASMSISVSAGDYIELLMVTPAWATNPTNVGTSASIYVA